MKEEHGLGSKSRAGEVVGGRLVLGRSKRTTREVGRGILICGGGS